MALTRREHAGVVWPADMFRRFFDSDWTDSGWLRMEEYRDGDNLVIRGEIPDIDPEKNVEIIIENDTLRVRAEREEKSEVSKKDGYRSEFRYGSFERTVQLPPGVDPKAVEATYADGILRVTVPVPDSKAETTRVVPVRVEAH